MNFTVSAAYRSDNNLVRIQSEQLAENYLTEFEEMFLDHQFGAGSPANTPLSILDVEGNQVEVYFSPDDGTMERVLELVQDAGESVHFMAYSFTDDDLAEAIIAAHNSGLEVAGVMDKAQALGNTGGEYQNLLENTSQKIHETKGLEGLKGFKGKVLKTSLTKDKEKCEDDDEDDSASVHWL